MVEETDNSKFARRLNDLISKRNISITQLSDKIGVTYEMVRRYTIGSAKPRTKIMRKLAEALSVEPSYLEYGAETGIVMGNCLQEKKANLDAFRVEVLNLSVSAGPGSYLLSDYVEVLYAIEFTSEHAYALFGSRSAEDIKVVTVSGDSMSKTINSGDRLFVDVSVRYFMADGIYAFVYDKTFHVKRLQMQGSKLAVLSDNPAYEKWYIDDITQDHFYVMGKALVHESISYNKL